MKRIFLFAAFFLIFSYTTSAENTQPGFFQGVKYKYYESGWRSLLSFIDSVEPVSAGITNDLFDISPRQTENEFGFVYSGYLDIPEDGVYTFYAPEEWLKLKIDAGYDIALWVGNEKWYPNLTGHANGGWSAALSAGKHSFKIKYIDYRRKMTKIFLVSDYYLFRFPRTEGMSVPNYPNLTADYVYSGVHPVIEISGPGLERQVIPQEMLFYIASEGDIRISEMDFSVGGENNKNINCNFNITAEKEKNCVALLTLYKKNENGLTIEKMEKIEISPDYILTGGKTRNINLSAALPGEKGSYAAKLYIWSDMTELTPLIQPVIFETEVD
jgi:hypothetical protein